MYIGPLLLVFLSKCVDLKLGGTYIVLMVSCPDGDCSLSHLYSTLWDNNFWLDLDFLDVAMAAQRCSAYFTSLLYIEIWHGAKYI